MQASLVAQEKRRSGLAAMRSAGKTGTDHANFSSSPGLPLFLQARHAVHGSPNQAGVLLQRKCACGSPASSSDEECAVCAGNTGLALQTKLKIGAPGDIYEQEADRIADQVLARPAHSIVNGVAPRIQRYAGPTVGQNDMVPASVEQVVSGSGRPLEPALRKDMEQRFGHDFSRVRVHSDGAAEQSAREVNASAYTVGHNIAFGVGQFAPGTHEGRRLLAHELTHVVQQSGGVDRGTHMSTSSTGGIGSLGRVSVQRQTAGVCDASNLGTLGPMFHKPEAEVKKLGLAEKILKGYVAPSETDYVLYCPHKASVPLKKLMPASTVYFIGSGKVKGKDEVWAQQQGESEMFWGFVKNDKYATIRTGTTTVQTPSPQPPEDKKKIEREAAEQERRQKALKESEQGRYAHTSSCSQEYLSSRVWPANDLARAMALYATQAVSRQYKSVDILGSTYFGRYWRRYRDDITANLNLISLGFEKGGYEYECEDDCSEDEYAYIWPLGWGHTIHLCQNTIMADKTVEGTAQTILHEMARSYAGADAAAGPGGETYSCQAEPSEEAADSPACLAHFAVAIFGKK